MPHVIVKLWPGKSEQQKTRLAEKNHQRRNGRLELRRRSHLRGFRGDSSKGLGGESL